MAATNRSQQELFKMLSDTSLRADIIASGYLGTLDRRVLQDMLMKLDEDAAIEVWNALPFATKRMVILLGCCRLSDKWNMRSTRIKKFIAADRDVARDVFERALATLDIDTAVCAANSGFL